MDKWAFVVCVHNAESECILGFLTKDLKTIVTSLRNLSGKAIPRVRGKLVYKILQSRE